MLKHAIITLSEGEGKASHRTPKGMQIARVTGAGTESLGDIGWSGEVQASLGAKLQKQKKLHLLVAIRPSIQKSRRLSKDRSDGETTLTR